MEVHILLRIFMSIAFVGVLGVCARVYMVLVIEPKRVRAILKQQGIDGPPPTLVFGNLSEIKKPRPAAKSKTNENQFDHNWPVYLFPYLEEWKNQYGQLFTFSMGNKLILYVNQPELVREISTCTSYDLGKPSYHRTEFGPLLGDGILTSNGPNWAVHRKILAPELYLDKVKGMAHLISESAAILIQSWNTKIESDGGTADINVDEHMRSFSGDVISRACFGSNYAKGTEIFSKLKTLQEATSDKLWVIGVPGLRYLPTKINRQIWALEKEIHTRILNVVKERKESGYDHKDLLQMVIEGAETQSSSDMSQDAMDRFIVDNCKNIYLAAHEATAIGASWCLMLLASNQEWQDRVRAEVLEICGARIPDTDMLRKMKQLTMVLQETLRLYPSGPALAREALKDMTIGGIFVPKGINLWTMVVTMHTDPEIWGPDAHSFNPERFANGVAGACKLAHAYLPFGFGPRLCIGQHLAMIELKMLVALLVSSYTFTLSPKYIHSPAVKLVIKPEHGVDLLVQKL